MSSTISSKILVLTSLDNGSGDKTSSLHLLAGTASSRIQLRPLFNAASKLRLETRLVSIDVDRPLILSELDTPSICLISKINHFDGLRVYGFAMAILAAVARMKARGVKIGLIYSDHLAPLPCMRGELYRDLLSLADFCIVPSQSMADRAKPFVNYSVPLTIIEDPWQVRLQPYKRLAPDKPLRLAWFGNTQNINFLCSQLEALMRTVSMVPKVQLLVLSSQSALRMAEESFAKCLPSAIRPWTLDLVVWDDRQQPYQLEHILGSAHMVWLPSDPGCDFKSGVSHNRLVDSVRSGCIPIASELQSYLELRKVALVGSDHGQLINFAVAQYQRLAVKYEQNRDIVLEKFSPQTNIRNWKNVLLSMSNAAN